jgi:hypothetical protein
MSILTHEPSPLYVLAENCDHIEPPEPAAGVDDGNAWDAYQDDHPVRYEPGERICLLTESPTETGRYCPACTAYAREEFGLASDAYIDAADCVHAPVIP